MGNSDSSENDQLPKSPLIVNLRNTLRFKFVVDNLTNSLIYEAFSNQFSVAKNSIMDRRMNPFCVLEVGDENSSEFQQRQWATCCIISPMMAIASPIYICRQDSTFYRACRVRGINRDEDVVVEVSDIIHIDAHYVVLLIFKQPLWELGWAGLTYLKTNKEIDETSFRLVNHPERKKESQKTVYIQKVIVPHLKSSNDTFKANHKDTVGSVICKLVQRKPYVVGIQISNINILFFNEQFLQKTQEKVKEYLKKEGRQKQFIKLIDLNKYEEETQW